MQSDAEVAKEGDGFVDRQCPQHAPDDRAPAAPEILLQHDGVRDVAPRAAADEDFRAGRSSALEEDDVQPGVETPREDGGGYPGRAGADDRDVAGRGKVQPANTVLCSVRLGRDDRRMRAARVAADDERFPVLEAADDLRPMTAALRAELRRHGLFGSFGVAVMNHNVVYSRNVVARSEHDLSCSI